MSTDYVDFGAVLANWVDAGVPATLVAFGNASVPGVSGAFSVTGSAVVYAWGGWTKPPYLNIERSTDSGATWTPAGGGFQFNGPEAPNVAVSGLLTGNPKQTGTALYRFRLDGLPPGSPISWEVRQ
jgi:hypothetical protein